MNKEITVSNETSKRKIRKKRVDKSLTKVEILAKGITTGIVVSAVTHAARGVTGFIIRQPIAMLGLGILTGYFVRQYRNEITYIADHTAEHGKQFVLRQKESLNELISEAEAYAAEHKKLSN